MITNGSNGSMDLWKFASFLRDKCFSFPIFEKERVYFYADPLPSSPRFSLVSSTSGSAPLLIVMPISWNYSCSFRLRTSGSATSANVVFSN